VSVKAAVENMPIIPAAAAPLPPAAHVPNPIRPTTATPAAHLDKEPGNIEEAVDAALAQG
jgi:hypothetical protein